MRLPTHQGVGWLRASIMKVCLTSNRKGHSVVEDTGARET